MNLSTNFTLDELCASTKAKELQIINQVTDAVHLQALKALAKEVLQPIRDMHGDPVTVTSGYRQPALNEAVGGTPKSQHPKGEAADITVGSPADNKALFEQIARSGIPYDQLICEFGGEWLHVSHRLHGPQRRQVLESYKAKGVTRYRDITKQYTL